SNQTCDHTCEKRNDKYFYICDSQGIHFWEKQHGSVVQFVDFAKPLVDKFK
ncbi:unnamed protein product, partial [Prunus brigantina]